ncbi:hypothetical protein ACFC5X_24530 [Streptomyces sp. NPDC055952]|uniref:hypothetical protein n=1 Tax=Streptomyces sp. NPDC055952 TaxID=3345663 RepID=UPI0035D9D6E8
MADEQYGWLDRETAERLLSGEPPEAVDAPGREQAERLAAILAALSAPPPPTGEEMPGEAAAVAAFRKARAERADALADRAAAVGRDRTGTADAGLVHLGHARAGTPAAVRGSRRFRPARLALAAALAVGMVGGVAVAAGTGVLTPFGGDTPAPGSSVSAGAPSPGRTPAPPSPSDAVQGGAGSGGLAPGGAPRGATGGAKRHEAGGGTSAKPEPGDGSGPSGGHREVLAAACRDLRQGKRLDDHRHRALRDAADGTRVWTYCKGLLAGADRGPAGRNGGGTAHGNGHGKGADKGKGKGTAHGNGTGTGKGAGQDKGAGQGEAGHQGRDRDKSDRKQDRDRGREQEAPGRKADGPAARPLRADGTSRGWTQQTLPPLRPAVLYARNVSSPRV